MFEHVGLAVAERQAAERQARSVGPDRAGWDASPDGDRLMDALTQQLEPLCFGERFVPHLYVLLGDDSLASAFLSDGMAHLLAPLGHTANAWIETIALLARLDAREDDPDAVRLSTLHAAKGLEYPHVFLVGAELIRRRPPRSTRPARCCGGWRP